MMHSVVLCGYIFMYILSLVCWGIMTHSQMFMLVFILFNFSSDELLLQEDNADVRHLTSEIANGMHLGHTTDTAGFPGGGVNYNWGYNHYRPSFNLCPLNERYVLFFLVLKLRIMHDLLKPSRMWALGILLTVLAMQTFCLELIFIINALLYYLLTSFCIEMPRIGDQDRFWFI